MVPVSLYVPDNVPRKFLNNAFESGLVDMVTLTDPYALFDRTKKSCACGTRNNLSIQGRTISVGMHQAFGFPLYALPVDCTFEETYVIVTWLLRYKLLTFKTKIVNGSLQRSLDRNTWFIAKKNRNCFCTNYTLIKDPVFMLSKIVLSPYAKGPVLESVVIDKVSHE